MPKYPFTPTIAALPSSVPFVGPDTHERLSGIPFRARIGANENVFGPSPLAQKAMKDAVSEVWKYGDSDNFQLREALAKMHNISVDNIVIGEGIDGLLALTCRMFVEPGRQVVTTNGAYPTFNFQVKGCGGTLNFVDMKDDHEDLDGLLEKTRQINATLLYVSNPNNPMGTWHKGEKINQLAQAMPQNSMLVLDEAYIEFAPDDCAPPIDVENPRIMRFRTFSKAYAMAGARIGYCIARADLISEVEKVRNHFGVNKIAQEGALAALKDQPYLEKVKSAVEDGKQEITKIANKHNLAVIPSATNFLAIDCKSDDKYARAIVEKMGERGIFIRMAWVAPQSRCIRVSVGKPQDHKLFEQALDEVLSELAHSK